MKQFFTLLFMICSLLSFGQKKWGQVRNQVQQIVDDFHGNMGVFIKDLKTGRTIEINGDSVYPTASMIKIPILIGIMHKINAGEFKFHQRMTYTDSLYYDVGDDILASFKNGKEIELAKVISLMLSYSDNTASLWLQGLSGGGSVINEYLNSMGLKETRVNSRTPGREQQREIFGWGQTTPREMAFLMEEIVDNKIIDRRVSEKMLRMLGRQYWDEYALSEIPPDIFVADKHGAVDASRGEVLYVTGKRPYIFTICSKNNEDQSWEYNNAAWTAIRSISSILWKSFNPKSKWEPTAPFD